MNDWLYRKDSAMPYQSWHPFPHYAIVQVRSAYYPHVQDNIGPAYRFWWGYEEEFGYIGEGVIVKAKRLDKPKKFEESLDETFSFIYIIDVSDRKVKTL